MFKEGPNSLAAVKVYILGEEKYFLLCVSVFFFHIVIN